jgi:N-acetylneuraminic acid mutarotase
VYDPATGTWTATGSMSAQRILYDAVVLSSSKVLVVAGFGITGRLASTELYDPAAGTWASAGTLTAPRDLHTATVLASGQVLVAGGFNNITRQLASAELYTP